MLTREQEYFDRTVADIFGFNSVQLGLPEQIFCATAASRCVSARVPVGNAVRLICTELPFECDSLDLVVMAACAGILRESAPDHP